MSLGNYIETEEDLQRALQFFKNVNLGSGKNYIKLEDAVQSLVDPESKPLISAHHQFAPRWVVCWQRHHKSSAATRVHSPHSQLTHRGTKREAVFTSVGLWRWNSDLETGNFVPIGHPAPEHLAEERMYVSDIAMQSPHINRTSSQATPNNLCQFSYALDTEKDKGLWVAQKVSPFALHDTRLLT